MIGAVLVIFALALVLATTLLRRETRQPVAVRRPVYDITDAVRFRHRK